MSWGTAVQRHKTVDDYVESCEHWQPELIRLRKILNATGLQETVKWGAPCYTSGGKNIVGIGAFKSYVGLWFFQGALLSDPGKELVNAQKGKTKAMRQWRFHSAKDIRANSIKAYVAEAIELAASGKQIKAERNKPVVIPSELKAALAADKAVAGAFDGLTPGKRREYAEYIADAKRAATKAKRIEKILPMIADGQGLNDKYRSC